jgi:hypothetical protein
MILPLFLPDAEGNDQTVEECGIKDIVKYLWAQENYKRWNSIRTELKRQWKY